MKNLGIYIHIPYCIKKCRYCDFVSGPVCDAALSPDEYSYRICKEIEAWVSENPEFAKTAQDNSQDKAAVTNCSTKAYQETYSVDSVFFGGGTPTCIGADMIGRILLCIKKCFNVTEDAELSIEANPETVNEKLAGALKFLGFNRVSVGVQSLNDNVLGIMGRVHDADKAKEAFRILRSAGFDNVNLDLMFGVPGQTFDIWRNTLEETLKLEPEHISFYSLQLEEGTPFFEDYKAGRIDIPDWMENRRMYRFAVERLKEAGYHHYEISNAAKPGKECRHNLKYWTMQPYLGFGTAAHSFIGGRRFYNTDEYFYTRIEEPADPKELETDCIFTGLRLTDGTDFGNEFVEKYRPVIEKMKAEELIEITDTRVRFTQKGLDNTNYVMGQFINYQE